MDVLGGGWGMGVEKERETLLLECTFRKQKVQSRLSVLLG